MTRPLVSRVTGVSFPLVWFRFCSPVKRASLGRASRLKAALGGSRGARAPLAHPGLGLLPGRRARGLCSSSPGKPRAPWPSAARPLGSRGEASAWWARPREAQQRPLVGAGAHGAFSQMGFLKKHGDGGLLYSVVNVAEPDADGAWPPRGRPSPRPAPPFVCTPPGVLEARNLFATRVPCRAGPVLEPREQPRLVSRSWPRDGSRGW